MSASVQPAPILIGNRHRGDSDSNGSHSSTHTQPSVVSTAETQPSTVPTCLTSPSDASPNSDENELAIERVLKRARAFKYSRNLQKRLALAAFKTSRGWQNLTLDAIEPHLEREAIEKRAMQQRRIARERQRSMNSSYMFHHHQVMGSPTLLGSPGRGNRSRPQQPQPVYYSSPVGSSYAPTPDAPTSPAFHLTHGHVYAPPQQDAGQQQLLQALINTQTGRHMSPTNTMNMGVGIGPEGFPEVVGQVTARSPRQKNSATRSSLQRPPLSAPLPLSHASERSPFQLAQSKYLAGTLSAPMMDAGGVPAPAPAPASASALPPTSDNVMSSAEAFRLGTPSHAGAFAMGQPGGLEHTASEMDGLDPRFARPSLSPAKSEYNFVNAAATLSGLKSEQPPIERPRTPKTATDDAELMLFLAASPSPARNRTNRAAADHGVGRRLFDDMPNMPMNSQRSTPAKPPSSINLEDPFTNNPATTTTLSNSEYAQFLASNGHHISF